MKRLPVNLRDQQHDDLRKLSFKDNKSMSDLVRIAVDEYLKKRKSNGRHVT